MNASNARVQQFSSAAPPSLDFAALYQQQQTPIVAPPARSDSVIMHANGGKKRKRAGQQQEVNDEDTDDESAVEQEKKMLKTEQGMRHQPVIGVKKFISPFAPEATIPLPHELEMSAHGTTVWKRNERERQRVRSLNAGYEQLRERLPLIDRDRRMSKADSLRLAIAYVRHLELLLQQGHAHWMECACFRRSYGSGDCSSPEENTPPPN